MGYILLVFWQIAAFATFVFLMIEDWPDIGPVNWLILVPLNGFLAQIWPVYWAILHWVG